MSAHGGRLRRTLAAAVPALLFALALVALHRLGGEFHLRDVLAEFAAIEWGQFAGAVLAAAGSYLALTGYERLALSQAGVALPWTRSGTTAFIAYAIGHNVGLAALSGAAVRYRMYGPHGLGAMDIARIVGFSTLTFALGVATLAGASLLVNAGEAGSLLHAPVAGARAAGAAMLAAVAAYIVACALRRRPLDFRGLSLTLPSPRLALGQVALASVDLALACACLYLLLPADTGISYPAFAGLYMVALAAGVLSSVPGGLGVFESVLVLLLPGVPAPQLLGALLGYRLVYYVLPFSIALLLLSAHEIARQRERLAIAASLARRSLDFVVPQAIAVLVFGTGFLLLLSGATPGAESRLAALGRALPLALLEVSHLAGSAAGVLLLILARGLLRRLDAAWHVTMWLLGAGVAASLLKGLDYEEAALLAAAMLPLWWTRRQFYRKASLFAEPLSPAWIASAAIAIGASVWTGLLAYRYVPYASELWWQFALDANAPRMLRASLLAVLMLASVASLRLLAPVRRPLPRPAPEDLERALPIIRAGPDASANLALLGDKALLFAASGSAFLMYGTARRSWVALRDPVGPDVEHEELVWRFRELADQAGAWSVFYQVSPDSLPIYVDAGLALSKLGEEARVPLDRFTLEGSARAGLRQAHRRAGREGLNFRVVGPGEAAARMAELRRVSDDWLGSRSTAEKGFSLGRFSDDYLRWFRFALVERAGTVVAFANLWECASKEELSVDLMRHGGGAPAGVMDFLFTELMLWGRSEGFRWFNLGMAPLAGLEEHPLAPAWHKVGRFLYRHGEDFYNFEGLRAYKAKFDPVWVPRYLAAPGGFALPAVLLDVSALISGSLRGVVAR